MKKISLYFWGIIFLLSSFKGFVQHGIGVSLICLFIGMCFISYAHSLNKSKSKSPENISVSTESPKIKTITMPVAGITFKNDDGSDRQLYLRKIKFFDPPFDQQQIVSLEKYFFNNEVAYYIKVNGIIIGNVPKEFISYLEQNKEREYKIEYFKVTGSGNGMNYGGELRIVYLDSL